ncbi:MAG: cysteine hydrolase [Planctomycetaceae bacterium]|jgi:nicotinamidase-related amidase|nr:cysteine hydrolase [Planctomycetaceae bacterium]
MNKKLLSASFIGTIFGAFFCAVFVCLPDGFPADTLTVNVQSRNPQSGTAVPEVQHWNPQETAVIICDMWDKHWCAGATARVAEMAPAMNDVLAAARKSGITIIHAPSETLHFYADHPGRKKLAQYAEKPLVQVSTARLDTEKSAKFPVSAKNGGCDCDNYCAYLDVYMREHGGKFPWQREIAALTADDNDLISDSGSEIGSYLQEHKFKNVIVMGVHTNMCVIGRSFGLRAMKRLGLNAVLMRDMTDTMYNHRGEPFVPHFEGTALVVKYIEQYVCPSMLSTDFTGKKPFLFKGAGEN